ncbi:hypothetical protein ACFLZC_01615 [Patescibacteria group bacterium]
MVEKIKTLIETSKSFGIITDKNPEDYEFLAKEALKRTLALKKIPALDLLTERVGLKDKWSPIIKPIAEIAFPQKTIIKLPKEKYDIKEVSYKEDDNNLSFVVTSKENEILNQDILLEKLPPETDSVFCFFGNDKKLEELRKTIKLPNNDKIIFIKQSEKTVTEKVLEIIKIFSPELANDMDTSTLLFASLITETNNFSTGITKESFFLATQLLGNNAQQELILEILEEDKKLFLAQLLGRALARTYVDESLEVSWSFLNSRDFQKTNNTSVSPQKLYELTKKMGNLIASQNLHVLIWKSSEGIKSLIAPGKNNNESYLLPLAKSLGAQMESKFFIIGPFENFSEAEIHIRKVITNFIKIG